MVQSLLIEDDAVAFRLVIGGACQRLKSSGVKLRRLRRHLQCSERQHLASSSRAACRRRMKSPCLMRRRRKRPPRPRQRPTAGSLRYQPLLSPASTLPVAAMFSSGLPAAEDFGDRHSGCRRNLRDRTGPSRTVGSVLILLLLLRQFRFELRPLGLASAQAGDDRFRRNRFVFTRRHQAGGAGQHRRRQARADRQQIGCCLQRLDVSRQRLVGGAGRLVAAAY